MISRIEALRYRCLRRVQQQIGRFHILVGPNSSGKSTFLDVPRLLGELLRDGLAAVSRRSSNLRNLTWMEAMDSFELAIELEIPEVRRMQLRNGYALARYEVAIGLDDRAELAIKGENLWLRPRREAELRQLEIFPDPESPCDSILHPEGRHSPTGYKKVLTKKPESGNDYFMAETSGWNNPFRIGPRKLALANLPEDEEKFPVATWVRRTLLEGLETLVLNSEAMRRPSPPGSPLDFQSDGSNLPRAIEELQRSNSDRFRQWLAHVRTALPDVRSVQVVERPEDRHKYLTITYDTGLCAPSWTVSDGTLRLLALTLVGYLDLPERVFLIEEPENGIHPLAIECVLQALSSTQECQVLCASHSPVVLSHADPSQLLCFARDASGATDVAPGPAHPRLRDWKREADLGTLLAAGVLG